MNLPNAITMARVLMIPVFIWFYTTGNEFIALGVYILAFISDVLDGYIARSRNLVTNFGKLMDPLADKLMLAAAVLCLYYGGNIPGWIVGVVLAKELIMILGGAFLLGKLKHVVMADWAGKIATGLFALAIVASFFAEYIEPYNLYLMYIAVAMTVYTLIHYAVNMLKILRGKKDAQCSG